MTEAHRNPVQAGVARLYHYQRFDPDRLTTTLRDQRIHCSDPSKLNDPWDCRPWFDSRPMAEDPQRLEALLAFYRSTATPDLLNHPSRPIWEDRVRNSPEALRSTLEDFSRQLESHLSKRRIYCLTPDPCSTLMWSHYAQNHTGLCLEFHVGNVLFLKALEVTYRSEYPIWVPQDMDAAALDLMLTKSDAWAYEKEFRLVGTTFPSSHPLKLDGDYLRLPPRALVAVIVGCLGDYDAIRRMVNECASGVAVKRAVRLPNHYSLNIANPKDV